MSSAFDIECMETRQLVLTIVVLVTGVLLVRGVVGLMNGDVGTVARQAAIGLILFAFGIGLVYRWDEVG
jgi:hypothetical protein